MPRLQADTRGEWHIMRVFPVASAPERGFTLIEIIFALVIMGLLAFVALPKYIEIQKLASAKALQLGVGALASQANVDFANAILARPDAATSWTGDAGAAALTVGDFAGSYAVNAGVVTVTVTGGANAKGSDVYDQASGLSNLSDFVSKSYRLYGP